MALSGRRKATNSLALPPRPSTPRPQLLDSTDETATSTCSSHLRSASTTSTATEGSTEGESDISHFSVSTILGLRGLGSSSSTSAGAAAAAAGPDKLKGEKARSLLKMLMRNQKINEDSTTHVSTDIHNLIPCGDVAGLLAVNVKQCKDFTSKFNVKHDTYLLIRISIDKIMKCTNPQMYRTHFRNKKMNAIYFGDVRYFSVKVPKQKSDPRNKIVLELVGFEGPKDFPRLFGNVTMHLYEIIQQSFIETCPMRIRNMIFCTVEVQFMFCYGCLGYGYSHQLKLPGSDPAQAVAYSMFLRVPPPEDRKDHASNVIKPLHMDYPAFLSPDLKVTGGSPKLETPKESSEHYKTLQRALKEPPRARLEKMKKEYRTLRTWREKAEYLDQLILKRGPKSKPQPKMSRFRELVEKIHIPVSQESTFYASSEAAVKEEKQISDIQKFSGIPPDLSNMYLQIPAPVPSRVESDSEEPAKGEILASVEQIELPALTVISSRPQSPESSSDKEKLEQKITREKISHVSETSLSSSGEITAEFSETGDSEPSPFPGPRSKTVREEKSVIEAPALDYLPEPKEKLPSKTSKESFSVSEIPVRISDSVVEPEQQWPWKEVTFQDAFFSENKFEPFLRRVCKVQPPTLNKSPIDYSILLEKTYTPVDAKEQEDQDPPPDLPLTKLDSGLDPKLIKSGEQLSILRLIEKKMDLEEEDKKIALQDEKETKPSTITSELYPKPQGDKLLEAEIKQVNVYFRNSLESFLVDKVVKVVALKSLLSKNIENLVAERLSGTELPQELEDSSSLNDRDKCSLKEITTSTTDMFPEPDISELKDIVSQHLQSQLIRKLSEKGIIPDMTLAENTQQVSLQSSSDLLKKVSLSKELTPQTEIITIKALSESEIKELSKSESMYGKERSHKIKPVFTEADLSEDRKDDHKETILLPLKSQTSSVEELKVDLRNTPSKKSLEIIKVKLPFSTETENIKKHSSFHDTLLQKILKAEIKSLKSFLSKGIQDHLKDKLSETGLSEEDLEKVCQKLSLNVKEKSNEGFNDSVLSKSIQDLLEALSESEIANLKSALNRKIQDHLSERISEIGLITQEELRKILETVFPVVAKETALRAAKGPDLVKEGQSVQQTSHVTQSLQDRFSEEELQNLKSLCGRLLKEGQGGKLSELEVQSLASVLQKSREELPPPSISETGISKEVEIKDVDHEVSLSSIESISKVSDVDLSDKAKHPSYENLPNTITAGEKYKKESLDLPMSSIFEVQTKNQETQTSLSRKVKQTSKKERYRLPGYPDNVEVSNLKRRSFEEVPQSKPQKEPSKKTSEPFAFSSFLSAHDIGAQTEIKNYLSKSPNYPPKPPFPVNPQTFFFLHPDSEEEAKPACKHHQKAKIKKSERKKDAALHHSQQGGSNPSAKKEKANSKTLPKDVLKEKGKKHGELTSKKSSTTENRKDSKTMLPMSGVKKESMKQKPEKKHDNEVKPKKSFSKTATLSDSQLSKNVQEKSSTIKFPATGHTKANTLNSIGIEDLDLEAYKHLEKAIERALLDLQGVEEGSCSQGKSISAPNVAGLMSKDALRSFPSALETPRNQAGTISDMLNNQDQIFKMTPEQLEVVLKVLHKILRQNSRPPNNG
ncbi:cation channel sperm-associated targeting subunit tau isoform 3-T3 [Liasis olivaceus]